MRLEREGILKVGGDGVKGGALYLPALKLSLGSVPSTFYPVSAARDEEGEVGGFQHIPRWCIPTAFTFSFQHY